MKRIYVNFVSILFIALSLVFTACNQGMTTGSETGTVWISIGGGAFRAVDPASGLPVFDETNTKITVTKEDGHKLVDGEQKTSVTIQVPIATKITVEVVVTTAAGVWRGSTEHTVKAGDNPVAVKLSKTPKGLANVLLSITGKDSSGSNLVSLSTKNGKKLLDGILVSSTKPITARDRSGRIYVLYTDASVHPPASHFKRFNVEGVEDTAFEGAITAQLPSGINISNINNIAIDAKDNYIFLFNQQTVYCFKEKEDHSFESFGDAVFPSGTSLVNVSAVAAYDDVLFVAEGNMLYACEFEFEDASGHAGAKRLKFESSATSKHLAGLRTHSNFGNDTPECTGLFADKRNVYCLLAQYKYDAGKVYTLGQLVRYTYSDTSLTEKTKKGLHPKAEDSDSVLPFEAASFSNPIGFIGSDEDHIYIADDGVNIDTVNENLRVNGNKNRIAAFNRKTNEITFTDTESTWYEEKEGYQFPETKILLWEKAPGGTYYGMQYWVADTANTPLPASSDHKVWFSTRPAVTPTDIFCYDQDGNLYILYKDSSNYKVRRFTLKADGTYNKDTAQDLALGISHTISGTPHTISAIAVDISDGKNYLYYADTQTFPHTIKRFEWGQAGHTSFPSADSDSAYTVTLSSDEVTALAANKDGVFVGLRTISISPAGYTLSVKKFTKGNGAPDGEEINLIVDAPLYTAHDVNAPYTSYNEAVHDLRIVDGTLYAVTSKLEQKMVRPMSDYRLDEFRSSGILYKVGSTASFSGTAEVLVKKEAVNPESGLGTGYGFYRFIAVKPKKLVIASDSAWGKGGANPVHGENQDTDTVLEYDLATHLASEPENAGGGFSKKLNKDLCEFKWE